LNAIVDIPSRTAQSESIAQCYILQAISTANCKPGT
jgi:hypothetical protein